MDYATCASFCTGYAYFGVEYSSQCFCGDSFVNPTSQVALDSCNMPCTGDEDEMCGGGDLLNIFQGVAPVVPPSNPTISGYTYQGCYSDDVGARVLDAQIQMAWEEMTIENCAAFCTGYTYFGAEWGQECYCGDSFVNPTSKLGQGSCDMVCADNVGEICGGSDALSVYEADSCSPPGQGGVTN
jgi:hypothetical protein